MVNSPSSPTVQSGSASVEPLAQFGLVSKTFCFSRAEFRTSSSLCDTRMRLPVVESGEIHRPRWKREREIWDS